MKSIIIILLISLCCLCALFIIYNNYNKKRKKNSIQNTKIAEVETINIDKVSNSTDKKENKNIIIKRPLVPIKNSPLILDGTPTMVIKTVLDRVAEHINKFEELKANYNEINSLSKDSKSPLLVVIIGEFKTGKSTFINAILREELLKSDVTPATAVVTMIKYSLNRVLIAYLKDGSTKQFPLDMLEKLSAEGDSSAEEFRSNISYIEIGIPNDILNDITIVDTPGLNADKPLHTIATKDFMNRADIVLWMFSYAKAGSRTELAEIKSLNNNLKPIGVVNRIDEIDPEEEDADELLDDLKKRLGDAVSHVVGVSALEAIESRRNNDISRLKSSRWDQFEIILKEQVISKHELKKCTSILLKLKGFIDRLNSIILLNENKYKEATEDFNKLSELLSHTKHRKLQLDALAKCWNTNSTHFYLQHIIKLDDLPNYIESYEKLNSQKKLITEVYSVLSEEKTKLDFSDEVKLKVDKDAYKKEYDSFKYEQDKYNSSGFFGGKPVFDFNGEGKRLQVKQAFLKNTQEVLWAREEELKDKINALNSRIDRSERDAKELYLNVRNNIKSSAELTKAKLVSINNELAESKQRVDKLKWVLNAKNALYKNIAPDINSGLVYIEQYIQKGRGITPIETTIHNIDNLTSKVLTNVD
ncbi:MULTISPECIES: dynamin family protein [unclassified Clostridium]|uniref:dynamin family protein n=1 Tax=unclassified Clostridium TaxID=2614128 RepID=UPI0002980CBC|nr:MULTISPECIES: dynamin family protein [unclassified Clostridium]EKQ57241.1 MAG: dynamin family protein [Clostridium sp. Maddingley MBC34-26]